MAGECVINPLPLLSAEYPFTDLEERYVSPVIKPRQQKSSLFSKSK